MGSSCELASCRCRAETAQYVDTELGCSSTLSRDALAKGAAARLWVGAHR